MPTDLGNLLIRVTSQGFDEVLANLQNLETVMGRLGSNSALVKITQLLDQMDRRLKDMSGDLAEINIRQEKNNAAMGSSQRTIEESSTKYAAFGKTLKSVGSVITAFWIAVAVPRKFLQSMERISAFNLSLTNMAINANTTRSALVGLGAVVEGLGGTRQGLAGAMNRMRSDMQNLRMGRGGGATMDIATLYGLDIRGSGPNGLATTQEQLRHYAELFERMGNSAVAQEQKYDIKNRAGFDDGTFRMLTRGVAAFDAEVRKSEEHARRMASAYASQKDIAERKADIDRQWLDAEAKMAEAMSPVTRTLQEWEKSIAQMIQKNPWLGFIKQGWDMVKELAPVVAGVLALRSLTKTGKAVTSIANATRATGTVGTVAGAAGKVAGGFAGIVTGIVDAVAGGVQRQIQIHSLSVLEKVIVAWHGEWSAFTLTSNMGRNKNLVNADGFRKVLDSSGISDRKLQNLWITAAQNAYEMNSYVARVNEHEYKKRVKEYGQESVSKGGNGITISKIDIVVHSDATDAEAVAQAVRDELFKQINASIIDAKRGSRVL